MNANKLLFVIALAFTVLLFCMPKEEVVDQITSEEYTKKRGSTKLQRSEKIAEEEFEKTVDPALGEVPKWRLMNVMKEIEDYELKVSSRKAAISGVSWEERGPRNVSGRTRAILIDDADATGATVFAGGVGGGLWKSTNALDANPSWTEVNGLLDNIAIGSIAQDPNTPATIYMGTGEGWFNGDAIRGLGVWKSTDGGTTFSQLASTNNGTFYYCQKIAVTDNGTVLVATRDGGIQRSTDGGASFTKVLGFGASASTDRAADIEIAANDDIYVTMGIFDTDGIYKSTDDGASWTKLTGGGIATGRRIEIACAPSNEDRLIALFHSTANSDVSDIQRSDDGGTTWTNLTVPGAFGMTNFTRGQAWYDLIAAFDPNDDATIWIGGIDVLRSTDSGASWSQQTQWYGGGGYPYMHADQHAMVYHEGSSTRLFFGNDGGIYRTDNANAGGGASIVEIYNDYNVTQFYSCDISPTMGSNNFIAGSQDNGTQKFDMAGMNNTVEVTGGDGAFNHIDQDNPDVQTSQYTYNAYRVTTNNWGSFVSFNIGSSQGRFINPSDLDSDENNLYACYSAGRYSRIVGVGTTNTTSTHAVAEFPNDRLSTVRVSPNVTNRVYFGFPNGDIVRVDDAHGGSPSGTLLTRPTSGYMSCIEIEDGNENHIIVTYSNYGVNSVWESTNGGTSWTSIEGNLPDMPIRWVVFYPGENDQLMVATEMGVWTTDNINGGSTDWGPSNTGFANVRVDMLAVRQNDKTVIAATHGRGLFSFQASSCPNVGDIVITEIMQNPSAVNDSEGEWFEVYNTTGADINLDGWEIRDDGSDSHTIGSSLVVPAGGYVVLGNNGDMGTNGGVNIDYVYGTSWFLSNGDDEVVLECSGTEIDRVEYDGGPNFPDPNGASMNLDPGSFNSTDNNFGTNWCESISPYGDGDLGTPGGANVACETEGPTFDITISDPCACNDDATVNMMDGTFDETVTVSTNPPTTGLTILVGDGSTGLIGINIGDMFTDNNDGTYSINFDHADAIGYTMNVAQDVTSNIIGSISNTCYYPVPAIDNLAADYCENDPVVNLMGSAQLGDLSGSATAESETWSGPGVSGSTFDPMAAGPGMHTIVYEFNALDDDPDAQHPGCISSVSQIVEVNAQPDAPMVDDVEVCEDEKAVISPTPGAGGGGGQMVMALLEDFEDANVEYTTSEPEFSDGSGDFFIRTDGSNIGGFVNYSGQLGSSYFAGMDLDGEGASLPLFMNFDDVDVTGLTDLQFCVYLAEDDDGSNEDWDITDYVHFDYDMDNSGSFTPMIWVESEPDGDAFNAVPKIDTDYDGDGDGAEITSTFAQYCFNIPVTGSLIDIRIEFQLNAGDEDLAIDEVSLKGMGSGSNPAPMLIASDNFDAPVNLTSRSNTTDLGTQPDHEDQFTSAGDLFGITDGMSGTPMPRQAPFAIVDDAANPTCNGFFANDSQGVLPCDYGNNYFGVVDTENGDNMGTVSADWVFDISSATAGVTLVCIDIGAMGDFEASDTHTWTVDVDGGGFNSIFMLVADEAASATYNLTNGPFTLNDPMTLNGQQVLNGLTTYCAELNCPIGNELTLRLELATDGGTEAVAYDNIEIYGSTDPDQIVYKFYDQDPSGGGVTPVFCGAEYCPPTTVGTSPETYWVTSRSCDGCESDATEVTVTVNALPDAPTVNDVVVCEDEKPVIEPMPAGMSTAPMLIASDDFDAPSGLTGRSNTTDLGTVADHEDQFTSAGDLFGITDGMSGTPMPRQAPFAIVDDAANPTCNGFFSNDSQGVLPCDYGNNYFGVVDTENGDNMGTVSADWVFDISSATAGVILVCIDMGAMGDFEASDTHTWSVDVDGGGFNSIFMLEADEASSATYNLTNGPFTLNDPMTLNGQQVLNGLTTYCAELTDCPVGNELTLRLELATDGGTEAVAYDNIEIYGSTDPDQVVYKFYDQDPSMGGIDPVHCGPDYCPPTTLGTSPETYWVTAKTCEGCESEATEVMVTINPIPSVDPTDDMVHCDGDNVPGYPFTGSPTGTDFNWTASADVGFGTMGMGDVPPYTATTNGQVVPVVSEVIVTPSFTNLGVTCTGEPDTFLVTVNPTPDVDQVANILVCDQDMVPEIVFTGSVPGTDFSWTNNNTTIGLGGSGTGNIPSFTATNPGPGPQVATITVTPEFTNAGVTCVGDPITFTITVNARPIITFDRDSISICKYDSLDLSLLGAEIIENGSGAFDGTWTTSGDGTFDPNATWSTAMSYEPGPMDIEDGVFFITLTTDDPPGPCGPESMVFELVLEDPPPMVCTSVQASLGEDGMIEITPELILTGPLVDWTSYTVELELADGTPIMGSPFLNCSYKGEEIYARVTENCGGNSCWALVTLEDKIAPRITCPDPLVLDCNEDATPGGDELIVTSVNGVVNGGTTETFTTAVIPQSGCTQVFVKDVNLFFDVDYDFIGDIVHPNGITITSPQGTLFDIYPFAVNTACQTTFGVDAIFHGYDDESTNGAIALCVDLNSGEDYAPFAGMLSQYDTENPIGTWTWSVENLGTNPTIVNELRLEILVGCAIESPMVEENCTFELTYQDINDTRNVCGIGELTRIWTATDCSGLTATCSQSITFENIDPPTITWPADYEVDCFVDVSDLDPDDLNRPFDRPRFQDGDCSQYAVSYVDEYFDVCAPYGYKIRRTWTIIDWCDPNFEESEIQNIKVVDNTAPQISCPADFTVSLRHNDCAAVVSLPSVTATDNCDFNPIVTRELLDASGQVIPTVGVPTGRYRGRYIATDACGNMDTCYFNIRVVDPVAPVIVVIRDLVVSLTAGGWAYLCADQVDDGSSDNCTGVGSYIRRSDDDQIFNSYYQNLIRQNNCVRFQCRDLGEQIVWLRVYDDADGDGVFGPVDLDGNTVISAAEEAANGDNYNEAWANVTVEDKLPPVLVCPPDIALNCLTDFDDLELTGEPTVDLNCDREDPTYTDVVPHGYCPDSDIIRTWRIEKRLAGHDGVEGTADDIVWVRTCDQVITITDDTPVVIEKLPLDITIDCDGGAVGTDPEDLTKYNYFDDYLNTPQNPGDDSLVVYDFPVLDYDCEHIGINYEDQPFGLCLPGSYKIRRNWTVIDWCEPGFEITYTNVILVDDKEPPVLTVNNPGTVCITNNDPQCRMFADITASAFDLCSNVTITNNSPYGPGTHDASGVYPKGIYTITFTAVDGCGNVATEEITVSIVDCKAPTAICNFGLAVGLKQNCEVDLSATLLDAGSTDNCTDQANLSYEIARVSSTGDYVDRGESLILDCFDATNDNGGNVRVALFVIDSDGNEGICETVVNVQADQCPLCDATVDPTLTVTGSIIKPTGEGVNGVEITIDGASLGIQNGQYGMLIDKDQNGMAYGVIEALKEDVVDNGVSTIDLVMIRRAILRLEELDDYQNIAADVNNDERVSTIDMVAIRQAILKQIDEFEKVPSWRFVPTGHTFGAATWEQPIPFVYEVESDATEMEVNFYAMKMGDVTGDADVNSSRMKGVFDLTAKDATYSAGEIVSVDVNSEQLENMLGYQFTLSFDAEKLQFTGIEGDLDQRNINADYASKGLIAISKVSEDSEGNGLFTLIFEAVADVRLSDAMEISSELTRAEAYETEKGRMDVSLNFVTQGDTYALYQNVPNPFGEHTNIGFYLPESGEATIRVMDISGRLLYTKTDIFEAGSNNIVINRNELENVGVMYYQLQSGDFIATKKMILAK